MCLILRPADPRELPQVAALMNLAYRGTSPTVGWTSETYIDGPRTSETALQIELDTHPEGALLVTPVSRDAAIEGCVWLEPLPANVWYLGSLTVAPTLQNSGLGRKLLESAEVWAKQRGASTIQMTVINIRCTLIAWYERRGYKLTGEIRPFPYGDDRFGKPRRDDLAFVVLRKPHISRVRVARISAWSADLRLAVLYHSSRNTSSGFCPSTR